MADQITTELIIKAITQGFDKISGDLKGVNQAMGENQKSTAKSGIAWGQLIGQVIGVTSALAVAKKAFDFTKESALLAARVETLGVVTETLGKNVGMTEKEVRDLEASIQKLGITTQGSRQAIAQMIEADIDLKYATDLARLSQDAAVIAGENSSDAFQALTQSIATANVRLARQRGLLVDFEGAYMKMAKELGVTTTALSEQEKTQARVNAMMEAGKNITGTYEAAMETAGKKIASYARYWEELKLAVGRKIEMGPFVDILTKATKALTEAIDAKRKWNESFEEEAKNIKLSTGSWEDYVDSLIQYMVEQKKLAPASAKSAKELAMLSGNLDYLQKSFPEVAAEITLYTQKQLEAQIAVRGHEGATRGLHSALQDTTEVVEDNINAEKSEEEQLKLTQQALGQTTEMEKWYAEAARQRGNASRWASQQVLDGLAAEQAKWQEWYDFVTTGFIDLTGAIGNPISEIDRMQERFAFAQAGGDKLMAVLSLIGSAVISPEVQTEALMRAEIMALQLAVRLGQISETEAIAQIKIAYGGTDADAAALLNKDFIKELEAIEAFVAEADLKVKDEATEIVDNLAEGLEAISKDWIIPVYIEVHGEFPPVPGGPPTPPGTQPTGGGTTPGGGTPSGGGEPVIGGKMAAGTGGNWRKVPAGFPNDTYPVWMSSGEEYAVLTPAQKAGGAGGPTKIVNITQINHVSNNNERAVLMHNSMIEGQRNALVAESMNR